VLNRVLDPLENTNFELLARLGRHVLESFSLRLGTIHGP